MSLESRIWKIFSKKLNEVQIFYQKTGIKMISYGLKRRKFKSLKIPNLTSSESYTKTMIIESDNFKVTNSPPKRGKKNLSKF